MFDVAEWISIETRPTPSRAHNLRIIENRCIVGNRSLPFLACERSDRRGIVGFDGLYTFISRLPDAQRYATLRQIPSGGVEIDGLLLKNGGRGTERIFLQERRRTRL